MNNINFENKRVLITGATRGIGFSIASYILSFNANIIITGRTKESCEKSISKLKNVKHSGSLDFCVVDFSNDSSFSEFLNSKFFDMGFDIIINNAGANIIKSFETYNTKDVDYLNRLNFLAPFEICKRNMRYMKANKYGRILNIASIWSKISKPHRALYTSTKHAVVGLTKTLSLEFGEYNILTNCLSPGFTLTDLTKESLTEKEIQNLSNEIPVKRMANPDEIAKIASFLVSNLNTYINGQNIIADIGK